MQPFRSEEAPVESLSAILLDPSRLADLGPTEEEVMADLMWPAPVEWRERRS
jgi:hypothetical protein